MSKNLKIFLFTFLLSLPFWWGINLLQENLEDFLYQKEVLTNPGILAALSQEENLAEKLKEIKFSKKIDAKAATSVFVEKNSNGKEKILFRKNIDQKLPIASLTKLMTALLVLENYDLTDDKTTDLLYFMLVGSSNEAANKLAEKIGQENFVELMNLYGQELGLKNTHFINPSGLDGGGEFNYSTAQDLVKFTKYLLENQPSLWEILRTEEYKGTTTTNELLGEVPSIVGGKTGETPAAGGCLLLVVKAPHSQGYLINVILGSKNRFQEMKKLIRWAQTKL